MQVNDITRDRIRRLAAAHVEGAKVLSAYLDLDPSTFGTAPARATAIRSLLDEAARAVRECEGLSHDAEAGLRDDLQQLEAFFENDFSAEGARGLAIFASSAADLFEVVRLPQATQTRVVVADAPFLEPLVRIGTGARFAVMLVSRADGRLFRGTADWLTEVATLDDDVHGQHSAGGWSQARYERSVDEDARRHVERVLAALRRSDAASPFDLLLLAAPDEVAGFVEHHLDERTRSRLAARFMCDVSNTTAQQVLEAARPEMEEAEDQRERQLLDRLSDALGMDGRAATGLGQVLDGLVQRRVETLLIEEGFSEPGVECPACGWLGAHGDVCPIDSTALTRHADIGEIAIVRAQQQDAEVVTVRHYPDLRSSGGIASLDRF